MRVELKALREGFERFSQRERVMLLLAVLVVFYQLADTLLLSQQGEQFRQLERNLVSQRQEMAQMAVRVAELTRQLKNDPNALLRQRNDALRSRVREDRRDLQALAEKLVVPRQMAVVLEQVLAEQQGLQLLRLQTLPPTVLNAPGKGEQKAAQNVFPIYAHAFSVEFSGDYISTLRYLESLESLPAGFYWDRVDFEVNEYPESRVRLQLHTLSISEDWIGV